MLETYHEYIVAEYLSGEPMPAEFTAAVADWTTEELESAAVDFVASLFERDICQGIAWLSMFTKEMMPAIHAHIREAHPNIGIAGASHLNLPKGYGL